MDKQLLEQEAKKWLETQPFTVPVKNMNEYNFRIEAYIAGATSSSTVKAVKEKLTKEIVYLEDSLNKKDSTVKNLEREVERLKGMVEVAFKSDGSWDKFKTENNL